MEHKNCELCSNVGGELIASNDLLRVVRVHDEKYPAFCRVILNRHVTEMTHLSSDERYQLMDAVFIVERTMLDALNPRKINLASFGNMVSHLHWHVIPRFEDDPHFPNAVWGEQLRDSQRSVPAEFWGLLEKNISTQLNR
jgi:diadenosine tetraphosphate (Ap4A) HIT family hydrolase